MDTVLQHARMFGYRAELMPYTRVFLPEYLAFRFHYIHVSEKRLRTLLLTSDPRSRIPVQTATGLRATRANVLDTGSLSGYSPGEQVYPIAPDLSAASSRKSAKVEAALKGAMGGALRTGEFVQTTMGSAIELMKLVPFDEEDAGSWDPDTLAKILGTMSDKYGDRAFLYYRTMERRKARLTTGAASGSEVRGALDKNAPVLFLFRDSGKYLGQEFWYPTLVLPSDMPVQVFNLT